MIEELRVSFILWEGEVGGAETLALALSPALREFGVDAGLVCVTRGEFVRVGAERSSIRYTEMRLPRGSSILRHPRRYANTASRAGADAAVVMTSGYMASALRWGGYRGAIVGVEHGDILRAESRLTVRGARDRLDLSLGARAIDAQIAVSRHVAQVLARWPHGPVLEAIWNPVDCSRFRPRSRLGRPPSEIGWAGRLIEGKGVDTCIEAVRILANEGLIVRLRIGGVGPLEDLLRRKARGLPVTFVGRVSDMPAFWNSVDVAAVVPGTFNESFGLAAAEAQACGRPVIATSNGGLPEVVRDGVTGTMVNRDDPDALAGAIRAYVEQTGLAEQHGRAARTHASRAFDMRHAAERYAAVIRAAVSSRATR